MVLCWGAHGLQANILLQPAGPLSGKQGWPELMKLVSAFLLDITPGFLSILSLPLCEASGSPLLFSEPFAPHL